jgi:hypothetical protein
VVDGVTIIRAIELADPKENSGATLIREVSTMFPRKFCSVLEAQLAAKRISSGYF